MEDNKDFIQKQNEIRQDYKISSKVPYPIEVLRKRSTKGIIFLLAFSIAVPVLIYYFIIDKGVEISNQNTTCSVDSTYRIQCGISNATLDYCSSINCCFDNSTKLCFHYVPSKYYYFLDGPSYIRSLEKTPFKKEMLPNISLTINEIDENNVEIILHDTNINIQSQNVTNKNYFYKINETYLYVEVFRNDTEDVLLTTAKGPMIISERYWEWSFQLTDQYLFGLGQTLIELDKNSTLTKVIYGNSKDHNTLPIFLAYLKGSYHGLIVRHGGPLEVTVLPSKLVSLKSLAGEKIVLEVSVGPTIQDVMKQQRRNHVANVELETLGVHLCREGSSISLQSILADYRQEISASKDVEFRYESDCIHENLVMASMNDNKDTNIANLREEINTLINGGRRFILSLIPQVLDGSSFYEDTSNISVFYQTIKTNKTVDYKGKFFGSTVAYPYFGHPSISEYLQAYINELKRIFGESIGKDFILGYNWPADDSFKMEASDDDFQYLSDALKEAMSGTLPWNVRSNSEYHLAHHIDYAAVQIEKLKEVLGTESTFVTAFHNFDVTEPLILQNIDISWTNFRNAIITILSNSIFGYPLTSVPVCGSTVNFNSSHESLCMRWYLMSSTAPIFRISSDSPRRDPNSLALLTTKTTGNKAKDAIDLRYSLRYYFYTVLNNNEPLMRPMFYDFPDDNETFPLVHQYMVGKSLLVAQPTLPDQTQIEVYLPKSVDTWYEFWGGQAYRYSVRNTSLITSFIVETDWVAFIPEGVIIPSTETSTTDENTEVVRLIVALNPRENTATGSLKFGSQSTFNFMSTDQELTVTKDVGNATEETVTFLLNEITIYSTSNIMTCQQINQTLIDTTLSYSSNCQNV